MSLVILAGTLRVPGDKIAAVSERLPDMIAASRAETGVKVYSLAWDPLEGKSCGCTKCTPISLRSKRIARARIWRRGGN